MATSVSLGNFFSVNGRSVLGSAGGSGVDTQSLITALVDAKSQSKVQLEDKVTLNDTRITALQEFNTLLGKLKDATNLLRNPPGISNAANNIFQFTSTSVASNTSISGENYVQASSTAGASLRSYIIDSITSVASAKQQSTGDFVIADADTAVVATVAGPTQIQAGTVTINGQTITFTNGDSLNTVVSKINQKSSLTGIDASVVKVSGSHYRILFTATSTGEDATFNLGDPGDPTVSSVSDPGGVFSQIVFDTTNEATNAEFDFGGIPIERQSNAIDDLVDNVTFTIMQETPVSTAVTITVSPDRAIAKNGVINFINAYNDLRIFYAKQTKVGADGVPDKDAVLVSDTTVRSIMNNLASELGRVTDGLTGDYTRIGDIGITFADLPESADNPYVRNVLTLDESKLEEALAADFTAVSQVFGLSFSADNASLAVYSSTNDLAVSAFTLNLDFPSSTTATYLDADNVSHTIAVDVASVGTTGYSISGREGTVLEGLVMVYGSTSDATINVDISQAVAGRMYNISSDAAKANTGLVAEALKTIQDSNTRYSDEIAKMDDAIATFRNQLLDKFAAMERAIAQVNVLLQQLSAQADARLAANS